MMMEITLMMTNPQKNDQLGIETTKGMILQMPFLPNDIGAMFQIEEVGKTKGNKKKRDLRKKTFQFPDLAV
jgi:hypothetical protein